MKRLYEFRGEMLTVGEIAKKLGMTEGAVYVRLSRSKSVDAPRKMGVGSENRLESHWNGVSYEDDLVARRFVAAHPEGASQDIVAEAMGCSKALVSLIERAALAKLRARVEGADDPDGFRDALADVLNRKPTMQEAIDLAAVLDAPQAEQPAKRARRLYRKAERARQLRAMRASNG